MKHNLLIGMLGHRNSGKSTTWYELFEERVRTGNNIRRLNLTNTEYIEVFLVSGSPEERDLYVGDIIGDLRPRIVFCSMQYISNVIDTIDYFVDNDYFLYVQWLNPGHHDQNNMPHADYLGIIQRLLSLDATVSIRDGKKNPKERVQELVDYLYGWAASRNLLLRDPR
ncbi:MAG: hypothetical protein ACK4S0_01225 [Sediminibacterium sp.]